MNRFEAFVEALEGAGCKPKRGRGRWMAFCPSHEDGNRSLSVSEGTDGKDLVTCFAGCDYKSIREALGNPVARTGKSSLPPTRDEIPEPRALPTGRLLTTWIYRDSDGEAVFAVIRRDNQKGEKQGYTQWTPHGGGWIPKGPQGTRPLYNLPHLMDLPPDETVGVVEGEKCADAFHRAWPDQPVTTWAGGASSWQKTDFQPLYGRQVILVADGDPEGHKAMLAIADHLHRNKCTVKLVLPPEKDVADWLDEGGPDLAINIIQEHMDEYEPDGPPHPADTVTPEEIDTPAANQHYRVLGLVGDSVAIWISAGRVIIRTGESLCQRSTLIRLAPRTWWTAITGDEVLGPHHCAAIGDSLIRYADRQGQLDLSNITGRGAAVIDNRVIWHLGDRLLIDNNPAPLGEPTGTRIWIAESPIALSEKQATDYQLAAFTEAVMSYRWSTPDDGRRLLGWVVAGLVGGALDWRPHVLLTAPASTGKSWMLNHVVRQIMGPMVHDLSDATPAALSRLTQSSALPVIVDEAEPTHQWVLDLLQLLRNAAGGSGQRIRTDMATGGVTSYRPRFSALLSATVSPRLGKADDTRLSSIRLGAPVKDWNTVERSILAAGQPAEAIRARIVHATPTIVDTAQTLRRELQTRGVDTRKAHISAALTAGWRFWRPGTTRVVTSGTGGQESNDAADALFDILALKIRVSPTSEHSVLYLLDAELSLATISDLYGVRRDNRGLLVAPGHRGLVRALSRSVWGNQNLTQLLLQIPGVERTNPLRFANGQRLRAVRVPTSTLIDLGLDLTPMERDRYDRHEGAR